MAYLEMELLESRLMLSNGVLAAGQTVLFDLDGNGTKDAVLVNEGTSPLEYGYSSESGLDYVKITASGAKFSTNTWVAAVGDNNADQDFYLASARLGADIRYRCQSFNGIVGTSSVVEGSLGQLRVGRGDLASVTTTEAGIDWVTICRGNLVDLSSQADVNVIAIGGNILGNVDVVGNVGELSANRITGGEFTVGGAIINLDADAITGGEQIQAGSIGVASVGTIGDSTSIVTFGDFGRLCAGTIENASITVLGNMGSLRADTLSGSESYTSLAVIGHVQEIRVQTMTGGVNGTLALSVGAGVDRFIVGTLDGGQAVSAQGIDGETISGFSQADISVTGAIGCFQAGLLSGGEATGEGSFSMLAFSVNDLWGDEGVAVAGDVNKMCVGVIAGGEALDGANAMLTLSIAHDLVDGRVSQIIGSGQHQTVEDPAVYISVGHDIIKLVAGSITAGTANGDYAYAEVGIWAGNDIQKLVAGSIDGGSAMGDFASVSVNIRAGRDIGLISADTFSGGVSGGEGAMAGVYVSAGRNINNIAAGLISGTQARRPIADPTVQFVAGGDIGTVMAGRITGGSVTSDGQFAAEASVLLRADGTYFDDDGVQSAGNIGAIYAGTIRGGTANGAGALAHVNISAANDIRKLYADEISGGRTMNGGMAYVDILAEHDIIELNAGIIRGSENPGAGCDPSVQIRAFNDIKKLVADQIVAGENGVVNILAGLDAAGNVSGELDAEGNLVAGSIERLIVGVISGNGGIVNVAAGGSIDQLKACQVISGDGEVNIVAGEDITADVGRVRSWAIQGETGVTFSAGGAVNDVRNTIASQYTSEGGPVEFPEPIEA